MTIDERGMIRLLMSEPSTAALDDFIADNPLGARDRDGRTLLMNATVGSALTPGGYPNAVAHLIGKGADVDAADDSGLTALHLAAIHNRHECAALLVEAGAALEARDDRGNTPLWRAAMNSGPTVTEVLRLLIDAGADLDHANDSGVTPRDVMPEEDKRADTAP